MTSVPTIASSDTQADPAAVPGPAAYVSLHEQRVRMVAAILSTHAPITADAAHGVALQVVYDLDHRPETVRYRG